MGTPTPNGAGVEVGFPRKARCPKSGHAYPGGVELMLGLHQKCPRVVNLVMKLHHVSQRGNQGEFWIRGATA